MVFSLAQGRLVPRQGLFGAQGPLEEKPGSGGEKAGKE